MYVLKNMKYALALMLVAFAAYAWQAAEQTGLKGDVVAAARGWEMIGNGALLIDVRSPEEYDQGHIEDSLLIPHTQMDDIVAAIGPDHDRPVVLYCRSGGRAGRVQTALEEMGYTGIFNATGWDALEATRPPAE